MVVAIERFAPELTAETLAESVVDPEEFSRPKLVIDGPTEKLPLPDAPFAPEAEPARIPASVTVAAWPSTPVAVWPVASVAVAEPEPDLRPVLVVAAATERVAAPDPAFAPLEVAVVATDLVVTAAAPLAPELVADDATDRVVEPKLFSRPDADRLEAMASAVAPDLATA